MAKPIRPRKIEPEKLKLNLKVKFESKVEIEFLKLVSQQSIVEPLLNYMSNCSLAIAPVKLNLKVEIEFKVKLECQINAWSC